MVFGYAPATNGLHGQMELSTASAKSRFLLVICCTVPLKLHGVEGFCLEDWADQGVHLDGGVRLHNHQGMEFNTPQEEERHYLRHVATEPEEPTTGGGDDQANLVQDV